MQLPRGKFRSIRKGVKLSDILAELASLRFTGISTLSSVTVNGTLVFKEGVCVLAKVQNTFGEVAFTTVNDQPDLVVDTALSDLDNAQLQLALDFNKKARVGSSGPAMKKPSPPQAAGAARPSSTPPQHEVTPRQRQKEREFIKTNAEPSTATTTVPRPGVSDARPHPSRAESPKDIQVEIHRSPAEDDLDTFESMDLEDVAQKIRKDCKIILKQLQLDHLSEK